MELINFIKENKNWKELLTEKPYCLSIKEKENLALLKYNQLESDMSNKIVQECRGVIIDTEKNSGHFKTKHSFNEEFFQKESKELYFLLGLLASDGNVNDGNVISIGQSRDRGEKLISFIKDLIDYTGPIYKGKQNNHIISISSEYLKRKLHKYGIRPRKTYDFNINQNYNPLFMKYFIQGYVEGDGHIGIHSNGNGIDYLLLEMVGTENLIMSLCSHIGDNCKVKKIERCANLFELRINGKNAEGVIKDIWEDPIYPEGKLSAFSQKPEFRLYTKKYIALKQEAQSIIDEKNIQNPNQLSKVFTKVPCQTLYDWKNRGELIFNESD